MTAAAKQKDPEITALEQAFGLFTETTEKLQRSHDELRGRVAKLTVELAEKNRALVDQIAEGERLRSSLSNVLESITDGVIAVDTAGRVSTVNRAAREMLGMKDGASGAVLDVLGSGRDELARLISEGFLGETHANVDIQASGPEGETLALSVSATPIHDSAGRRVGAVGYFRDLTLMRAMEARMRRGERLAALGEMAAGVAHEIRNPLGGIKLYAGLLVRALEANEKDRALAEKITTGTDHLNTIVEGMLAFTREMEVRRDPIDLAEVAGASIELAAGAIESSGARVELVGEAEVPAVGDAEMLRRVLLNIITNGCQALEPGGTVTVECARGAGRLGASVTVTDSGSGIAAEALDKVFNPFFTAREGGTGLGLAISHRIVEAHGGEIAAENIPSGGARFTVRIEGASK